MTSDPGSSEYYVYLHLPGRVEAVTACRYRVETNRADAKGGTFVYGKCYLEHPAAVELDPVELRIREREFITRMGGIFDRRVCARGCGLHLFASGRLALSPNGGIAPQEREIPAMAWDLPKGGDSGYAHRARRVRRLGASPNAGIAPEKERFRLWGTDSGYGGPKGN